EHLYLRVEEVVHRYSVPVVSYSQHPGFRADGFYLRSGCAFGELRHLPGHNRIIQVHPGRVYPEDLGAAVDVREAYVYYAVEPAGAKQSIVQYVRAVRGPYDLDLAQGGESVQLRQELHQGPLDLAVARGGYVKS